MLLVLFSALVLFLPSTPIATLPRSDDVGLATLTLKQEVAERRAFVLKATSQRPDDQPKPTGPALALPSPVAAIAWVYERIQTAAASTREIRHHPSRPASQGPPALA
jgi:hypothetical protein